MAKDGTARGGPRVGQGRKTKALAEKLAAGNPGHRPMLVMDLPEGTQLDGEEIFCSIRGCASRSSVV